MSFIPYNNNNYQHAKQMRKNMTKEERHLWFDFLRDYLIKIYRQRRIDNYIADFYCTKAKLVIELDGSQHYQTEGELSDKVRTNRLEEYRMTVIRIPNNEVMSNFTGVCEYIDKVIQTQINPTD